LRITVHHLPASLPTLSTTPQSILAAFVMGAGGCHFGLPLHPELRNLSRPKLPVCWLNNGLVALSSELKLMGGLGWYSSATL